MIYIIDDEKVKKYNIVINKEELKKIRKNIINNCSKIEHKKQEVSCFASVGWEPCISIEEGRQEIRNLKKKFLRMEDNLNYRYVHEKKFNIYELEYDLYTYPDKCLLYLIDSAIKGYEYDAYKLLMMESKRKVPKNNFDFNISVKNEYDAKKLKKKLDDLINTKKTIDDYMLDIINSISLVLVDVIEYDVYKKFYNFVDQDLKQKIDQKIYVKACKTK